MNNLFSVHWNGAEGGPRKIDYPPNCPTPSGFGRLLAAVAVIGIAVCALDHISAGRAATGTVVAYGDTGIAYGSSEKGSWK